MVFDLICLDGDFVGDELLAARLVQIGEYIIKPFRLKLQALDELIPFDLIGKRLVPIEMGFSVLKCIRTEKHERFYQVVSSLLYVCRFVVLVINTILYRMIRGFIKLMVLYLLLEGPTKLKPVTNSSSGSTKTYKQ